ncbi:MBL fold metallo-hydrolase [Tsukamurella tyrosinosolvens]|uniref:MBL fold metallo-hydrolase n=1 Tax=Tsukamurella tyrosinosolvens TaxID=57704 RepID=UPI000DF6DFA2|nr:MBL fold metallo-hydrolase [Tsukamurella tyrosinosolvens]RDB48792.1 MBL fold metallo-hydrolase [Tsukamurella tyrosinosolvens]
MTDTTGQIATDPIIDRVAPTALSTCCRAVGQSLAGAVRPRRPDPARIARLREALVAPPASSVTVRLRALPQIPRVVRSMTVLEGVRSPATIRMDMRTYVIDHPSARILLDPSVASQVRERVLGAMQPMLRAAVMPSPDVLSTVEALHRGGVDPASVDLALSTHLHWDHVSGLLDLPALPLMAHRREHEWAVAGELAPAAGVRPALAGRTMDLRDLDGPPVLAFPASHDVFGDGAVVLVDLAGHTPGSVGVLLNTERGRVLMAGDAVWHSEQLVHGAQKAAFPGLLVDVDRDATFATMTRLMALPGDVTVVPCHDHDLAARWAKDEGGA